MHAFRRLLDDLPLVGAVIDHGIMRISLFLTLFLDMVAHSLDLKASRQAAHCWSRGRPWCHEDVLVATWT